MTIAGARPNFVKVAPLIAAFNRLDPAPGHILVHTGQHYDHQMSRVFFEELDMPDPDEYLGVGSGSHAVQTAAILLAFEPVLLKHQPNWVIVVGDVNSTLACALVCAKLGVPVAHVEAGLRSGDRTMPEEINRLLTDQIADLLFTPSPDGNANLRREGIPAEKIHFVGNVMIDTLVRLLPRAQARPILTELGLPPGGYLLVTLHRPANVDQPGPLGEILSALQNLSQQLPIIFPVHPRTRERMQHFGLSAPGVRFLEPLGYLDFLALTQAAGLVLTDSGGIQEETTYLGVPCLTARPSTERPVTLASGNRLVASQRQAILDAVAQARAAPRSSARIPALWDGHTAERIAAILHEQR
ncbi:MAG: UDP-N-acetylglucosamine 2-epimerase (non-hydrolyzing) [Chloroflexota bacterium]